MARVLLLLPKSSYRAQPFLDGAARAGVSVRVASDVCHVLHEAWGSGALTVDFDAPEAAALRIAEACAAEPVDAIVPVTDATALVAALAAERMGLAANAPAAAYAARNKRALREALAAAGVPQPAFHVASLDDDRVCIAARAFRPCVVKPVLLSASRGVIRADDPDAVIAALARIDAILAMPDLGGIEDADHRTVLVEAFVEGPEVALEGLLTRTPSPGGATLRTLALFDKPDPLDGPYFEETIYVTPSRLPPATQERIRVVAEAAARAMGLCTGPVHAELRLQGGDTPVVIEIAARSIGGLCGRALRFDADMSLEEIVVRHAVGEEVSARALSAGASGVMMLPVPAPGVLEEVTGVDDARAVPGIEDVVIGAPTGTKLVPLPEGGSYLGFLFARGETPAAVEAALREAHAKLGFRVAVALS
jgi:biotin carboxylase